VDHSCGEPFAMMVPRHLTKLWWVPEELNLSTPAALFHSRPGYSRLSGKGPGAGGPIRTDTGARFKLAASAVGLRQRGATSEIRTHTARGLKPLPPTSWATVALVRAAGFEPALFTTSR
jgi:hypothetical protein